MDGGITEIAAVGSLISGVAGAGISALAAKQSGDYQAAVAKQNSIAAANMARYDAEAGAAKAQDEDLRSSAQIGKVIAGESASGLDVNSGSPASEISSTSEIARLNTLRTADNSQLQVTSDVKKSQDFATDSQFDTMRGDYGAVSSLMGGATSFSDRWSSFQQKGLLVV